jgi:hypothetical protein
MAEAAKVYVMPSEGPLSEIGDRKVYLVHEVEPEDHPAIDISISRQDSVHWISSDRRFRVTELKLKYKCKGADDNPPEQPFYRTFPDDNREFAYQVNSGPARPGTHECTYEAHFEFEDGTQGDPHIQIHK